MNEELEAEIAARLDRGDVNGALAVVEEGYGAEIFGFMRARLGDATRAEDAYGEFRLKLVRGIHGFQRRSAFRTWAYRIAHRENLEWAYDEA